MKILLWDIDGTVLDFLAAEKAAIKSLFREFGIGDCTDEMIRQYSEINKEYWKKLERGEMSKPEILRRRFDDFFSLTGADADAEAFNNAYQIRLGDTIVFIDEADRLLKRLKDKGYKQYAVTNGTRVAQRNKLEKGGLYPLFDGIFISEEVGAEKPSPDFFGAVFKSIGNPDLSDVMIIGDSLTSDIKGGRNAGITTCYFNRESSLSSPDVDIEIHSLYELEKILLPHEAEK